MFTDKLHNIAFIIADESHLIILLLLNYIIISIMNDYLANVVHLLSPLL